MRYVIGVGILVVAGILTALFSQDRKELPPAQGVPVEQERDENANASPQASDHRPPLEEGEQRFDRAVVAPHGGPQDETELAAAGNSYVAFSELSSQMQQQLRNAVREYGTRSQRRKLEEIVEIDAARLAEYEALSRRFADDRRMALQVLSDEIEKIKGSINLGESGPQFRRWPDEDAYLKEGSAFLKTEEPGIYKISVYGNEPGYRGEVFGVISVRLDDYPALKTAIEYKGSFDEQRDLLYLEAYKMVVSALSDPNQKEE